MKITLKDVDRLHEIALGLDTFHYLLGMSSETEQHDGLSLLIEPLVRDLKAIDGRLVSDSRKLVSNARKMTKPLAEMSQQELVECYNAGGFVAIEDQFIDELMRRLGKGDEAQ